MKIINKRLLSVIEAANYLSISRAKLYQWLAKGKIPSVRIDNRRLIDIRDLDQFIDDLKEENKK
ncbi:helix-turn-helix domain-containing protein [bacterium]